MSLDSISILFTSESAELTDSSSQLYGVIFCISLSVTETITVNSSANKTF